MKALYFILPLIFSVSNLYADEICSISVDPKVDQLSEQNCEITDKLNSCAQKDQDLGSLRENFTKLLDRTIDKKEDFKNHWKNYSNSVFSPFFDETKSSQAEKPTHLYEWFNNQGKNKIELDTFRSNLINNYVKFAEKHECKPILKHRFTRLTYPSDVKFETLAELNKFLSDPKYQQEKNAFFENLKKTSIDNGMICDQDLVDRNSYHVVAEEFPPCAGNLSGLYKDNVWESSTLDEKLASDITNPVVACIKDRIAKGAKIHHVSVSTSASALNNTGEASKRFCKKGFLELSKARAENAKENLIPKLFSQAGVTEFGLTNVNVNYKGTNGDGTSGPCPYKLNSNGTEEMKPYFKTADGKDELHPQKFVKLHITFESLSRPVKNAKSYYSPLYICRQIRHDCEPFK